MFAYVRRHKDLLDADESFQQLVAADAQRRGKKVLVAIIESGRACAPSAVRRFQREAMVHFYRCARDASVRDDAHLRVLLRNDEGKPVNGKKKDTKEGVKEGIKERIREGIREGVKEGIREGVKEGIREGVKEGIREGVKEGIREGVREKEKDEPKANDVNERVVWNREVGVIKKHNSEVLPTKKQNSQVLSLKKQESEMIQLRRLESEHQLFSYIRPFSPYTPPVSPPLSSPRRLWSARSRGVSAGSSRRRASSASPRMHVSHAAQALACVRDMVVHVDFLDCFCSVEVVVIPSEKRREDGSEGRSEEVTTERKGEKIVIKDVPVQLGVPMTQVQVSSSFELPLSTSIVLAVLSTTRPVVRVVVRMPACLGMCDAGVEYLYDVIDPPFHMPYVDTHGRTFAYELVETTEVDYGLLLRPGEKRWIEKEREKMQRREKERKEGKERGNDKKRGDEKEEGKIVHSGGGKCGHTVYHYVRRELEHVFVRGLVHAHEFDDGVSCKAVLGLEPEE